ncbi:MAG: hypothetical protein KFB93_03820 [Simkaniaceae bacterium]|nr:MAG: hypothetical protein KFB93_03820 [Simkaniaceae bacterium]
MKKCLLIFSTLLLFTGCSNNDSLASQFSSLKGRFFKSEREQQLDKVYTAIRDGDLDKAELEISQISSPFARATALGQLAHYEIFEKNDLISAKKIAEKLEGVIQDIPSKEDKLFAEIQLVDLKHFIDKSASKDLLKKIYPEVWSIVNPEERSRLLIRIVALELETQRDVSKAKHTIEETRQTIDFIQKSKIKDLRTKELNNLLYVNNHILCQTL